MATNKKGTALTVLQSTGHEDAVFIGRQKTSSGLDFALYNITAAGHPSQGSTVTGETLHKMNLQVPANRPPQGPMQRFRSPERK